MRALSNKSAIIFAGLRIWVGRLGGRKRYAASEIELKRFECGGGMLLLHGA